MGHHKENFIINRMNGARYAIKGAIKDYREKNGIANPVEAEKAH